MLLYMYRGKGSIKSATWLLDRYVQLNLTISLINYTLPYVVTNSPVVLKTDMHWLSKSVTYIKPL